MLARRVVCGGWLLTLAVGATPAWGQRDDAVPVRAVRVVELGGECHRE